MEPKKHPDEMTLTELVNDIVSLSKSGLKDKVNQRLAEIEPKLTESRRPEIKNCILIVKDNEKFLNGVSSQIIDLFEKWLDI